MSGQPQPPIRRRRDEMLAMFDRATKRDRRLARTLADILEHAARSPQGGLLETVGCVVQADIARRAP